MNNNIYNGLERLDIITIAGFLMQIENIKMDNVQNKYVKENIERIENELSKINNKLDKILERMDSTYYGTYY